MKTSRCWIPALAAGMLVLFPPNLARVRGADAPPTALPGADATAGRALFLKNCAHCHGADAHGDEGPDLHKLDETDEWIARRIRNGKAGQMTAFAGKLQPEQITNVIMYLRTLK